jgi:hypothetical protein
MSDDESENSSELGGLVKDYKQSRSRLRQLILIMLFSTCVSLCFFLTAIFTKDLSTSGIITRVGLTLPGLLFSLPLIFGIRQVSLERGNSLSLYENGLIFRSRGKETRTTWDEIDSYMQESACRITKNDGQVIEFGLSIQGADEVADVVLEQTLRRILPKVKKAILAGASYQFTGLKPFDNRLFGKNLNNLSYASSGFSVDLHGITALDDHQHIAWKDVTEYGITQDKMGRIPVDVFFVQAGNTGLRTRLGLLSNAHVLLALCDEMTNLKQGNKAA